MMTRKDVMAARERLVAELAAASKVLRAECFEAARAIVEGTAKKPADTSKARARVAELEAVLSGLDRVMVYAEFQDLGDKGGLGPVGSRLGQIGMSDPDLAQYIRAEKAASEEKAADCGDPRRTERVAK